LRREFEVVKLENMPLEEEPFYNLKRDLNDPTRKVAEKIDLLAHKQT